MKSKHLKKKLVLKKETIAKLLQKELSEIRGGAYSIDTCPATACTMLCTAPCPVTVILEC